MKDASAHALRRDAIAANDWAKDRDWRRLVEAVATAATSAAEDEDQIHYYIAEGFRIVDACVHAVNETAWKFGEEDGFKLRYWYHRPNLQFGGKTRGEPYIDRQSVEEALSRYVDLPYRVDMLDRLLLDLSMAQEILAFADEMQPALKRKLPRPLSWIGINLLSLIIGGAIAIFLLWIAPNSVIAFWLAMIVAGITVLGTLWSLIAFPISYPAIRRADQKLQLVVSSMCDAYATLSSAPASTKHIEGRVERATDAGVVWPAPMIVLLEDIRSRRTSV